MMVPVFVRAHTFHAYHFGRKYKDRSGRIMNTKPSLHFGPGWYYRKFQKTKHSIALVAMYISQDHMLQKLNILRNSG